MALLPRRFQRLDFVLNHRMSDLTVVLDNVEKSHNLSAILRSCDAVGITEAYAVNFATQLRVFKSTALGSQKWIRLNNETSIGQTITRLKQRGFKIYGTQLNTASLEYHQCDFVGPTAFVLGAEKWGLSEITTHLIDQSISIPMMGMVQSLNVSVAASVLLFEVLRQRQVNQTLPIMREGLSLAHRHKLLFEYSYPRIADGYRKRNYPYPNIDDYGQIIKDLEEPIT
ncbi:putative tRNA (guanosine-2'-O-) - methyltransferase (chromatophore) [Paulinella micropora]|uniref:tRNA (Guanosine-2'-O-)-methyltransferase n=1 Tax=Paulinella micropora TaxID=1928728 RepID=A0A1L5YB43_9EUKA|nr:putative tRNA (guanosine-2'-O-) - methyltransferase [Paulinella micropora]AQX44678.1 putative tRNA (guanosine-2'-O-) - methyltransferase [Paulinella micropora]BBL85885.1 putative tRNA (guanosine-2'-O-) - methyltransferase [Paulinella micropora]